MSHCFPWSWNSFNIYGVISNYQNPGDGLAYIQFYLRNDKLLLFCYGICGRSKYGCLNFCIVQTISSFWDGLYASTYAILFCEFFSVFLTCVCFKSFHSLSFIKIGLIVQTVYVIRFIEWKNKILLFLSTGIKKITAFFIFFNNEKWY